MDELTTIEQTELAQYEAVIERGLQAFYEIGSALFDIKTKGLYKQYGTFENYCQERWRFSGDRANMLIRGTGVYENIKQSPTMVGLLPENERQTRPLAQFTPDQQTIVWQKAVELANGEQPTYRHVETAIEEIRNIEPAFNYKRDTKSNRAADEYVPQGYDACQTPAYAIDPLLPFLSSDWIIWEPACGEGYLVEALFDSSFQDIIGTDILTGHNFLEYEPDAWDCLITNPPFSLKYRWLERCYQLAKPFALLLPVETLGAKTAQEMFREHGIEVIFLDRRVNFKMPNAGWDGAGAQFPTAWFTWGLNIGRQMTFARLNGTTD